MAYTLPIQTNFTAGELSPRLQGRVDVSKYFNGLSLCRNFVVYAHGGVRRRPGLHFVQEVKNSTARTRLIPFEFSDIQAYIIEAGHLYFRFYKDNGRIEDPPGTPVEIATPYTESDLPDLRWAQSADVLYIVHPRHAPRKLTRSSHTAWTLSVVEFIDGPYLEINTTNTTITPSGTSGTVTLTASAPLFEASHVDSLWRLKHGSTWGYVRITAVTNSTTATAEVKTTLGGTTATKDWREGAWSTKRGFPRAVTFHEQRLWFLASDSKPQTAWASVTNDFENMADSKIDGTVLDTHAIVVTVAATKVNVGRWLLSTDRGLLIGTLGSEHEVRGDANKGLTPTTARVTGGSTKGSSKVPPLYVDGAALFVQRSGLKIRELRYSFDDDALRTRNLALLAEHLLSSAATSVVEMAFQNEPDPVLWVVRADGALLGLTYDRDQDVLGWHQHTTDGAFESIAVIPHPDLDRDQVWFVVRRTVNGTTRRYIEYFDDKGNPYTEYESLNTDSALTYIGPPATVFSGLDHLEGKTVAIVGDGAVYPPAVVMNGSVAISDPASRVEIGLPYVSEIETLRPEVQLPGGGTSQGRKKRWAEVVVRLYRSLGAVVFGERIPFRAVSDPMGQPPALFSGDKRKSNLGWDRDGKIMVSQDQPLPCTVIMLAGILEVSP